MASVHFGRLIGAVGFSRTVAIKYLHPHYASDAEFVSMFVDEARLAARIQHPNVTVPLDVVLESSGEIFLVMEYVHGETLAHLIGRARSSSVRSPLSVSAGIINGALHGLHAAHEAVDERGEPLTIVHRDISPQNIMVGADGVARVLDFGVAKAVSRFQSTRQGQLKGKLSYMAPEQLRSGPIDRRVDIFAAGIVLWEALTHRRLFRPDDPVTALAMVLSEPIHPPSTINSDVPAALDRVVMKALDRDANARFQTARQFADAIEEVIPLASPRKIGEWVQRLCGEELAQRAETIAEIERTTSNPDEAVSPEAVAVNRTMDLSDTLEVGRIAAGGKLQNHDLHAASTAGRGEIVSTPSQRLPSAARARATRLAIVGAAVVGLVVVAGLLRLSRRSENISPIGQTPPFPVSRLPPVQPSPPPIILPPNPAATLPSSMSETPSKSDSTGDQENVVRSVAKHASRSAGRRTAATRAGGSKAHSSSTTAPKNCDPPYYIDVQGIRRIKPHCL